jgi:hypothetical protein
LFAKVREAQFKREENIITTAVGCNGAASTLAIWKVESKAPSCHPENFFLPKEFIINFRGFNYTYNNKLTEEREHEPTSK